MEIAALLGGVALIEGQPGGHSAGDMNPVALVYRFVLHTLAGVFLFSIVGGVVVLLSQGTILIERYGAPAYAMLAVRGLESFLFAIDFLCIMVFVTAETWTFLRDVIRSASGGRHE
jgi:hypothetical protein